MSSKKENEWVECSKCRRSFPKKYVLGHVDTCKNEETHYDSKTSLNSGFINKGVLFAKAINNASTNEKGNFSGRKDLITLHVSTIKALGLHLGSLVVLHLNNKQIMRTVWPSSQIPVDNVGINVSTLGIYMVSVGDIVTVHGFSGVSCHANKVELSPCKPLEFDMASHFTEYCSCYLENRFVYPGEIVDVPYYGKMKQFIVTSIETEDGTYSYSSTDASHHDYLLNDFKYLRLDENVKDVPLDVSSDNDPQKDNSLLQSDVSQGSALDERNEGSIVMDASDISKYYSLLGDSIDLDADSNNDGNGRLLTSTPLKVDRSLQRCSGISASCSRCVAGQTVYYITAAATKLTVSQLHESRGKPQCDKEKLTYDAVGGLTEQIEMLKEIVELPLKASSVFKSYGLVPPSGVLLYGPSGTGKTLLAKTVARESGAYFISLNGPDVLSRYYGETEAKLRDIFLDAQRNAPCIIFIDELDALCPKRDKVQNEFEKRVVATLLTLMDGLTTVS